MPSRLVAYLALVDHFAPARALVFLVFCPPILFPQIEISSRALVPQSLMSNLVWILVNPLVSPVPPTSRRIEISSALLHPLAQLPPILVSVFRRSQEVSAVAAAGAALLPPAAAIGVSVPWYSEITVG